MDISNNNKELNSNIITEKVGNNIIKLIVLENEYMCKSFASNFSLEIDEVIKVAFTKLIEDYPNLLQDGFLKDDEIKKLKLTELKDELRIRGLKISGNKKILCSRLIDYIKHIKKIISE